MDERLYSSMNEAYRMLGIDSIPEVKIKGGANTTYDKPYFTELWRLMDDERKINQKELERTKNWRTLSKEPSPLLETESG